MAYSGRFTPRNPQKYKGDVNNIVWRSLWERAVMVKLDEWAEVVEWASEELIIPYRFKLDNKMHRYFPDFCVLVKKPDGTELRLVLEVKPKARVLEPKKPKRVTKRFVGEVIEWERNQAKWEAARAYCADRKWEFQIITEDNIFGKKAK
jgi:hypothetical protein